MQKFKLFISAIILFLICARQMIAGQAGLIAFYGICVFLIAKNGINNSTLKGGITILFMLIFPFLIGILKFNSLAVFKDVFYFLSPFFSIIVGQYLARKRTPEFVLKSICLCGLLSAIVIAIGTFVTTGIDGIINPRLARSESIIGVNAMVLVSCAIYLNSILYGKTDWIIGNKWLGFWLCLFAVYLSGTRTLWVTELILMLFISGTYIKRHIGKAILVISTAIVASVALIIANPENGMVRMIMHTADEISTDHRFTHKEIIDNYRGYETYRTLTTFNHLPLFNKCFGDGFGATVDMLTSELVGLRYVPIMHNGYVYILIKSGYLGIILFILWGVLLYRKILKTKVLKGSILDFFKHLSLGVVVMIYFINASVWGFVNSFYNVSLFIPGAFLYYTSRRQLKS